MIEYNIEDIMNTQETPMSIEFAEANDSVKKHKDIHRSELGQYYTTNYEYILQKMEIPENVNHIIEPFAGNGDLLKFIPNKNNYVIELYDIEPKIENTIRRDTLNNPPNYNNKFVLTNPPYLARNKNKNKNLYDKYKCNDLYKCFIMNLINSECIGGIIIIPINFISSIRKQDIEIRKKFLNKFNIIMMNVFEEKVFDDTSYAVCSIQFTIGSGYTNPSRIIKMNIFPFEREINILLTSDNNYTIGNEIYNLPINPKYKIERATRTTKEIEFITNILLKCIDDNHEKQLGLRIVKDEDRFIDNTENLSARSYATLVINKKMSIIEQEQLVNRFNEFIQENRMKYNSLFLTNYRDSNTIARKRISFDLAFRICNYLLSNM